MREDPMLARQTVEAGPEHRTPANPMPERSMLAARTAVLAPIAGSWMQAGSMPAR
jgi:hypothetical protein